MTAPAVKKALAKMTTVELLKGYRLTAINLPTTSLAKKIRLILISEEKSVQ